MKKLYIGKNKDSVGAYENALTCYVYGRVSLNTEWFLFLLPSIFYLFHHSIEVSIKTLMRIKDVNYPYGMDGHKISLLIKIASESGLYSDSIAQLLSNHELMRLLEVMDNSYLDNKYEYPGYNLIEVPLRDLIDKIIYTLFNEINSILKSNNHALAVVNVPAAVEESFLYKLNVPIPYHILDIRKY